MRASAQCALLMIGSLVLAAPLALAQDAQQAPEATGEELAPEAPLTPEESALLSSALVFDPAALATPPKKPLRLPGVSDKPYDVKRTEKADGSATVVLKQPLPAGWENTVGADLSPSNTGTSAPYDRPLASTRDGSRLASR